MLSAFKVQGCYSSIGSSISFLFCNQQMGISHSCQLRKMCNAQDLFILGNTAKLLCHFLSRPTGNTGIHFIENQCVHLILFGKDIFHSQHNTCQLTA